MADYSNMFVQVSESEVKKNHRKTPNQKYADELVKAFVETGFDNVKVIGWPNGETKVASRRQNLVQAVYNDDLNDVVKVTQHGENLYLSLAKEG